MKTFRIGRVPQNNDLVLPSPVISSSHAEIVVDDYNRIIVTDHSTNGTYVNDQLLHHGSCEVTVKDKIAFPDGTVLDWNLLFGDTASQYASRMGIPDNPQGVEAGAIPSEYGERVEQKSESFQIVSFSRTFADAFQFGGKNMLSVLGVWLLWILTCWIPYVNVGTTIALVTLPLKMSEGTVINPLYIFESKYRKNMPGFILTAVLMSLALCAAFAFLVIPGIVLALSWSLALYYLVGANMNPIQALQASGEATYGSKWTIFFVRFLLSLLCNVAVSLVCGLLSSMVSSLAGAIVVIVVALILIICAQSIVCAASASIWMQLRDNVRHE